MALNIFGVGSFHHGIGLSQSAYGRYSSLYRKRIFLHVIIPHKRTNRQQLTGVAEAQTEYNFTPMQHNPRFQVRQRYPWCIALFPFYT